jgi:Xaa-Pro aminopeptidase
MPRQKLMNVEEFERELRDAGFDAVVATSQPNVFYTSGALILTQVEIPDRLALTVLPQGGSEALLVGNIEESLCKQESWIRDVRSYVEFEQSPIALLADVLREKGLATGRVGVEKKHLSAAYYQELVEALPQARFDSCDRLLELVRSIKTAGEIERFSKAAVATERAIVEAFRAARVGDTERGILKSIIDNVWDLGASDISFAVLAAGDHSFHAHAAPRERGVEPGDLIRVDFGAHFDGYGSDVARTAVVGPPSEKQRETYRKHRDVQRKAVDYMRPGVRACDVFQCCVDAYANVGIQYPAPHVGHGFGLGLHEMPILHPLNTQELRANMLIYIEPVLMLQDVGGFAVEDLVLVNEHGPAEILTTYAGTEEMFIIQ